MRDALAQAKRLIGSANLVATPRECRGFVCEAHFGEVVVRAVFDTGAQRSAIPTDLARRLGCRQVGTIPLRPGVGPVCTRPLFAGDRLQGVDLVGAFGTRMNVSFPQLAGCDIDTLCIGMDFLAQFTILAVREAMFLHYAPVAAHV